MNITTSQPVLVDPIIQWLLDRKISYEQLTLSGVSVRDNRITIPIRDDTGAVIFNKYRRSPFSQDGPKYTYDSGTTASLFNAHTITELRGSQIFITEGELDALLLNSCGLKAVSTTGGSGTFKEEWAKYFVGNEVFICYDKDEAGIRGALRVQEILPEAKLIFFPDSFKGKDVTDFLASNTIEKFLTLRDSATSWNIPENVDTVPQDKKEVNKIVRELKASLEKYASLLRDYNQEGKSTAHIDMLLEKLNNRYQTWNKIQKSASRPFSGNNGNNDIARAKEVSIKNYLKFNSAGFAKCPFHSDDSPSLKYYADNHVYCFGCSKRADTIDIVCAINNVDVKTAIKMILGKP